MPTEPLPYVKGLSNKVAVLERRLRHLESRLAKQDRTGASRDFDRAEANAVISALECMRYVGRARGVS